MPEIILFFAGVPFSGILLTYTFIIIVVYERTHKSWLLILKNTCLIALKII